MAAGNNAEIHVIRGKTSFAKILGDPVLNYSKDGKEWKMDLQITADTEKELKRLGIGDRVKRKDEYLDGQPFLTFKQKEYKNNGEANSPINVVDAAGNPWDQSKLIGNGSTVDVKFVVVDYGKGKKHGVYPRSVRVLDLVEYTRTEFEPLDESDEFFENAKAAAERKERELVEFRKDFGLESDTPDVDDLNDEIPL